MKNKNKKIIITSSAEKKPVMYSQKVIDRLTEENIKIKEKYESENKRLKREYDILDGIIEINNLKISELQKETERLNKRLLGIDKDGKYYYLDDNYRKALEEILNLCEKEITDCKNCKKQECATCNNKSAFAAKIIKVINSVLKENKNA